MFDRSPPGNPAEDGVNARRVGKVDLPPGFYIKVLKAVEQVAAARGSAFDQVGDITAYLHPWQSPATPSLPRVASGVICPWAGSESRVAPSSASCIEWGKPRFLNRTSGVEAAIAIG
jgi:hypothetical protein